ncbi:MAG: DUF4215 domain-containing protein [bacterium]|nr:DUF4215 domain-containing protein [bacterium]
MRNVIAIVALVASVGLVVPTSSDAKVSKECKASKKCRTAIVSRSGKAIKAGLKQVDKCHKSRDAGKTTADCNAVDGASLMSKGAGLIEKRCAATEPVRGLFRNNDPVGSLSTSIGTALSEGAGTALGSPTLGGEKALVKCHKAIAKAHTALVKAMLRQATVCQKVGDVGQCAFGPTACLSAIQPASAGADARRAALTRACSGVDLERIGTCSPFPDCVIDSARQTAALLAESLYSTPIVCGDGVVQGSEQCDDGNDIDDDGCTNACTVSACGDGVVQAPEECDDADLSNTNACVEGCKLATCGDGFVHEGVEECDDGNDDPSDGCDACKVAAVSCDPAVGYRITVSVAYDPAERDLNAITFDLGYPVGVSIPGKAQEPSVQARITILSGNEGDLIAIGNDKDVNSDGTDDLLTVGLLSFADTPEIKGDGIPPGDQVEVRFDCAEGANFAGSDFTCAVTSANDINGSEVPAACSVRVSAN